MMAFNLLPREDRFFELFENQANSILKGARFYKELAEGGKFDEKNIRLMHDIEHECDANTRSITALLNKTFITPFDREDIHELAEELDNIMDTMYSTVKRIKLYAITGIHEDIIQFAAYVEDCAAAVSRALSGLRTPKKTAPIYEACSDVKMIENQGDQLHDAIIEKLIANKGDAIEFIKWKEIVNGNEKILDFCKDVIKVIESILVKQG
jgi:predicted phosphate transport protein (TIGR00153 family)